MTGEEGESEGPAGPTSPLVEVARFSGHGLTLALATGLFLGLGWWADGRLGTTPLLTIVGALVGAAAGFYSLLQHLLLRPGAEARARQEAGEGLPGGADVPPRTNDAPGEDG